jgi:hypothetical protein
LDIGTSLGFCANVVLLVRDGLCECVISDKFISENSSYFHRSMITVIGSFMSLRFPQEIPLNNMPIRLWNRLPWTFSSICVITLYGSTFDIFVKFAILQ